MKDDLHLSAHPPLFPEIFGDSAIFDFPCVNLSMDASTADHSQNTLDVSPSFKKREEKFFIENPLDFSSSFSENAEGEHSCFSSTPLFDFQIIRMSMNLLIFLIVAVLIYLLL